MLKIYKQCTLNMSLALLIGIAIIYLLSCVGFIIHLPINVFYTIAGIIAGFFILIYKSKKDNLSNRAILIEVLIFCYIIVISYIFASCIFDYYYDGRSYHQGAIILLNNGWNPIYDQLTSVEKFNYFSTANMEFIKSYVKFGEIVSANILNLTCKIEIGKILNYLSLFLLFLYLSYTFTKFKNLKIYQNIILSVLICFNPIVLCQISTFYVDGLIYCYMLLVLTAIINIEKENDKSAKVIMALATVILANIKFVSLFYIPLIYLTYVIYLYIRKKDKTIFRSVTLVVLTTIIITGINPYMTNLKNNKHILHPIYGSEKIDMYTKNTPSIFLNNNPLRNLFISTFSKTENWLNASGKLKIPFSIAPDELMQWRPDIRVGGFGPLWGGILILALLNLLVMFFRRKGEPAEDCKILSFILVCLLLSVLLNTKGWWARYIPQAWAFPIFVILCSVIYGNYNIYNKFINIALILLMFINTSILSYNTFCIGHRYTNYIRGMIYTLKESNNNINFYAIDKNFQEGSFIQKIHEAGITYKFVGKQEYEQEISKYKPVPKLLDENLLWDYKY